jgi:hypothetical protein
MSRTVRVNPLLVLLSVLVGASIGSWIGGIFGAFVAALLAIPSAGAIQVLVREIWQATGPQPPTERAKPDTGDSDLERPALEGSNLEGSDLEGSDLEAPA